VFEYSYLYVYAHLIKHKIVVNGIMILSSNNFHMDNMAPFRIILIADDPLVGSSLEQILATDGRFQVSASYSLSAGPDPGIPIVSGETALVDLGWNPIAARNVLNSQTYSKRSLVLYPEGIAASDQMFVQYRGVLPRLSSPEEILAGLAAVAAGLQVRAYVPANPLLPGYEPGHTAMPVEALTPRELEVLACLLEGLSNKLIARRLKISEHTAKFHITSILGKLDAQSRTEAVIKAARLGLIRM